MAWTKVLECESPGGTWSNLYLDQVEVTRLSSSKIQISLKWRATAAAASYDSTAKINNVNLYTRSTGQQEHTLEKTGTKSWEVNDSNHQEHTGEFSLYVSVKGSTSVSAWGSNDGSYSYTVPKSAPEVFVNIGDAVREADAVYINVNGTIMEADSVYMNVNGTIVEA